jgi:hypothetical protein
MIQNTFQHCNTQHTVTVMMQQQEQLCTNARPELQCVAVILLLQPCRHAVTNKKRPHTMQSQAQLP